LEKSAKIYIAGHRGLVGSAILRKLQSDGYERILVRRKSELDLRNRAEVERLFQAEKPEHVFLAAAKVGGILANGTYPADFIRENLLIETNVIHASHLAGVKKLLFLGSSCIYPKFAPQPMKEEYFLSGKLEPTNEAYAIAKIAGIAMCQAYNRQYGTNFISVMPTNLYGPNDNFDLKHSHVLPALIRKFVEAKENGEQAVTVWGSGMPRREFLHVDDLANACVFIMRKYNDSEIVNIGTGEDISIRELAELIREVVGFKGSIAFDTSKPDGTPRKLLDVTKLHSMGWKAQIGLAQGIQETVQWYLENRGTTVEAAVVR
jgi:GDP-L-fucose synthase